MILTTTGEQAYELIDSGDGKKLERYGDFVLSRPDPQALWKPHKFSTDWNKAHGTFIRDGKKVSWKKKKDLPGTWVMPFGGLTFEIAPTTFKHTGLFPEQLPNWDWMRETIVAALQDPARKELNWPKKTDDAEKITGISVLNLFGYTGGASLACAQAGADVCHVDGSKMAIEWARKNQNLSGLDKAPIRWILDDALIFLKREIKRGNTYDAIIMDPPAFGHGPKGELWKIEDQFEELMDLCRKCLSDKPLFVVINGYASGYSCIAYQNNLLALQAAHGGTIESGELTIAESGTERLLPCGIFARWKA